MVRAAFTATVVPSVPAGMRLWFRWAVEVPFARDTEGREVVRGSRFRMRSLPDDRDDVWDYGDHATAYVGPATAKAISDRASDVVHGRIVCRVAFTPLGSRPGASTDSMLLEREVDFMNAAFARANHPDFAH